MTRRANNMRRSWANPREVGHTLAGVAAILMALAALWGLLLVAWALTEPPDGFSPFPAGLREQAPNLPQVVPRRRPQAGGDSFA